MNQGPLFGGSFRQWVTEMVILTVALLFLFTICARECHGQQKSDDFLILAPNAGAQTFCLGGRVRSVIDIDILGYDTVLPDSALEVLAHERSHQLRAIDSTGACVIYRTPAQLLDEEVKAYCESLPWRIKVEGGDIEAARKNYLLRLYNQFHGSLLDLMVQRAWDTGCPRQGEHS